MDSVAFFRCRAVLAALAVAGCGSPAGSAPIATVRSPQGAVAAMCGPHRGLRVNPCLVTFTKGQVQQIDVYPYLESGEQEKDDCKGIAWLSDASGPIWFVKGLRVQGQCTATFTEGH